MIAPDISRDHLRMHLRERILSATPMADQDQAGACLSLAGDDTVATLDRMVHDGALLRFTVNGKAVFPLFQFDMARRRIRPVIGQLIALKPDSWSNFRLLYWLIQSNLDFDSTPAAALGTEDEEVVQAFMRDIELPVHG